MSRIIADTAYIRRITDTASAIRRDTLRWFRSKINDLHDTKADTEGGVSPLLHPYRILLFL
jgi:hypothetical protein